MDLQSTQTVPVFIKPENLHLYSSVKYVDVRDPSSYAESHLKNAVNAYDLFTYLLPTSSKNDVDEMHSYFQKRFGELGITGSEHIVLYEQTMNDQYGASCRAYFIFKNMKHPCVSALEGGLDALIRLSDDAQLLTKELPSIIPCDYHIHNHDQVDYLMADREAVLDTVNNRFQKTWLIDVRDEIEWKGLSSSPYGVDFAPRKGRIPNAVWIEWFKFHLTDGDQCQLKFISNEQVQCLMQTYGIQRNDPIIVYCFKGSRASVALMKLTEAGFTNVRNYFASWNEWSRDLALPVDDQLIIDVKG